MQSGYDSNFKMISCIFFSEHPENDLQLLKMIFHFPSLVIPQDLTKYL